MKSVAVMIAIVFLLFKTYVKAWVFLVCLLSATAQAQKSPLLSLIKPPFVPVNWIGSVLVWFAFWGIYGKRFCKSVLQIKRVGAGQSLLPDARQIPLRRMWSACSRGTSHRTPDAGQHRRHKGIAESGQSYLSLS